MEKTICHKEYTLMLPIIHLPVFTQQPGFIAAGTQMAQKTSLHSAHANSKSFFMLSTFPFIEVLPSLLIFFNGNLLM